MISPMIFSQDNEPIDLMNPVKDASLDPTPVSDPWEKYLIMDVRQTSGIKPDGTMRSIIWGKNGDLYVLYNTIDMLGNGNMQAYVTKRTNIQKVFPLFIPKGKKITLRCAIGVTNGYLRLNFVWSYRILHWSTSLNLDPTKPEITVIATSDWMLDIQYADPSSGNMIVGFYLTIS